MTVERCASRLSISGEEIVTEPHQLVNYPS